GLTLAQAIKKHHPEKFKVVVYERDKGPRSRWQGYHVIFHQKTSRHLISAIPQNILSRINQITVNAAPRGKFSYCFIDEHSRIVAEHESEQAENIEKLANLPPNSTLFLSRDRLRETLLEGIEIYWEKKCCGYEETDDGVWALFDDGSKIFGDYLVGCDGIHSQVKKQRFPSIKTVDYKISLLISNVAVSERTINRILKISRGHLLSTCFGFKGSTNVIFFDLMPIWVKSDPEPRYRMTLQHISSPQDFDVFSPAKSPKELVDLITSQIEKQPSSELRSILLELWSLIPTEPDPNYPFQYIPLSRRTVMDFDSKTLPKEWETTKITLLGDAIHSMTGHLGLGLNNAIIDANVLANALSHFDDEGWENCVMKYEKEMRERTYPDIVASRFAAVRAHLIHDDYFSMYKRNVKLRWKALMSKL
ncbi:9485_t:CDS:2, partial [Ambispora leptoticha]